MEIKAIEESAGVVSMIRWVVRATTYIYGYTIVLVSGYWLYDAIFREVDWWAGLGIIGTAGASKGVSEFVKAIQKKSEVQGEIAETNAIVEDKQI